jgi:putative hydrolase of the HAD superfamily
MSIRAIFYDAGHTLVEPRPGINELWDFLGHQLGVQIGEEHRGEFPDVGAFFYSRLGEDGLGAYASDAAARNFWSEYYAYALHDAAPGVPREELLSAGSAMFDWYNDPAQWRPFPDVLDALKAAHGRGLIQGVVSDWGTDLLPILHAHEITLLMDFVVASAVVGSSKPHREIFLYALGRAGIEPSQALYVGDSYLADVLGSRAAGLHPVLIDREGKAPQIDAPVVHALTDLLDVVDRIDAGSIG